ncbi:MAG TPA: phosphoribosylanthranilate isomerase [Xanthobacteraceae bacterium]|nr:phosphoribosylanthranilate isomerase [Xanthobacteraceae bacterium]
MALLIKICGLTTPDTLEVALEAGADMVGFVFFPPSPRHLDGRLAETLGRRVADRARKVALTVDADDALLAAVIDCLKPDLLQLHGREPPDRVSAIKRRFGRAVIKAIPVGAPGDLGCLRAYATVADYVLFDARAPQAATRPGGLGSAFDWRLLENLDLGVPFMLSGGLDPENVARALALTRPQGVDVSSGVERAAGKKDPDKIRAFIRAAREVPENAAAVRSA